MRVSAHELGFFRGDKRRPRVAVVSRFENIRRHVAKRMPIKSGVSGCGVEVACLHPTDPRIFRKVGNVAHHISPGFSAITGKLKIAIICACPDQ